MIGIKFENVCKYYNNNLILDNISLEIEKSEFITILGPSGCGKTTLLKMLNRLNDFDCGNICINDKSIMDVEIVKLRRNIGYVLQKISLFPHMNVYENIMYVPNLLSKKERKRLNLDIEKCLKIVRLDKELLNRYPNELSGGQSQRVAIARALAVNPEVILMDEPFSALDEITRKQLQQEIKIIHQETKKTIIFVTHDVKEAFDLGDKVLILNKGKIEQFDKPKEILKNPSSSFVKELISNLL